MRSPTGDLTGISMFSTSDLTDVPGPKRIELWEQHNRSRLIPLTCHTLDERVLDATETNRQVEGVDLARVCGGAHVVERTESVVRSQPVEAVAVFFALKGEACFYSQDGVHTTRPGQALVVDADRPFLRAFTGGLEELVLKVPRELYAASVAAPPRRPHVFEFGHRGHAAAYALARIVGDSLRGDASRAVETSTILTHLRTLVAPDQPTRRLMPAPAHLAAAQAFIDRHLSDPALSAHRVASGVGISERHLSRVFAESGLSVPRYILNERLARARTLLTSPSGATSSITDVAAQCGFTSATYFSSSFRERFGVRASDARRHAISSRA